MASHEVRHQILEAAGPVFAERGFRDATVRDICAAAGVNLAAVNYYFGDKSRLYFETVTLAHQLRAKEIPMPAWAEDDSRETKLRGFIDALLQRMLGCKDVPWPTQLLLREVIQPTDACRGLVEDYFRPQLELLQSVLVEFLPAGVPEYRLHQLAFSVIGQCMFYRVAGDVVPMIISKKEARDHFSVEDLSEHVASTMIAALASIPKSWQETTASVSRKKSRRTK